MKISALAFCLATAVFVSLSRADDDFNDGVMSTEWSKVADNGTNLDLFEQNGQLELIASEGGVLSDDALYLSNGASGFRLSTDTDFSAKIDYSFSAVSGPTIGDKLFLVFGIGRDLPDGTDSAAIGYGFGTINFLGSAVTAPGTVFASRIDDVQSESGPLPNFIGSGTLAFAYDAAGDDATFTNTTTDGTNTFVDTFELNDTVKGIWGADAVFVSFGARGFGYGVSSGDAWLDNFEITSGQVVDVPEPAGLGLVLLGLLMFGTRRHS